MPKQFLSLGDASESLIQATARRMVPVVGKERIQVVAGTQLVPLIREHVPFARVIEEPEPKNTAACIGLAAAVAASGNEDPVLVFLPADHAVSNEAGLQAAIRQGITAARESDVLVTIGIPPTHPHTGYGYIKRGDHVSGRAYRVDRFYEKPSLERAEKYVEAGHYSWNSGMFVWRASVILAAFREHLPEMYEGLCAIGTELARAKGQWPAREIDAIFSRFESISVDFGILEHARNCVVIDAEPFGWNDVGSWDQWAESFKADSNGNFARGDAVVIDSTGCVIKSHKRLVAAVGLQDVIIIDSGDALLVVSRSHVQDVRKVVSELKARGRNELL
jgi:mannose-1-phosphate guanylyltransferase